MLSLLTGSGPWTWELRDCSPYGEYLNTHPGDHVRVRIHDTRQFRGQLPAASGDQQRPYRLTVELGPTMAAEREEYDQTVRGLFAQLDARDVAPAEPID
jgi:hypothetical protein